MCVKGERAREEEKRVRYLEPEMEIVEFETVDVITGSTFGNNGEVNPDITWPTD